MDPTENNFYMSILNDTHNTVVVSYCGTDNNLCHGKFYDTETLRPGQSIGPQTAVDDTNPWLVRSRTGKRLGCLPLLFGHNASGTIVRVSTLVPCQKHYSSQ
jgi:hypothetical protein